MFTCNIWIDALIMSALGILAGFIVVYGEQEREKFLRGDYDKP